MGYSLAYPVHDSSLSGYNLLLDNGWNKISSVAGADLLQRKLSRLGKLLGSYNNMLIAGIKSSRLNGITDEARNPEVVGFGTDAWQADTDVTITPSVGNNGFLEPDSQRGKRQQAWYVQYGKRSQGIYTQQEPSRLETLKETDLGPDRISSINKASPLFASSLSRAHGTRMIDYGILLPENDIELNGSDDLDSDSSARIQPNGRSDGILKVGKRDLSLQVKREQGWYTPYGKRSVADSYPGVL